MTRQYCFLFLVRSRQPNNLQDVHEYLHDIQIQIQRRKNVLLRTDRIFVLATHHHLRIVNEVDAEDECTKRRVNQRDSFAAHEYRHNAEDHQNYYGHEQHATHHCKVPLGLECKQCQPQADSCRDAHGHQNLYWIVAARSHRHDKCLRQCEKTQENKIHWRLPAHALAAGHRDHGYEDDAEGDPKQLRSALHKMLCRLVEQEQCNDAECEA